MFDRFTFSAQQEQPQGDTTVIEMRAPTDESVRLLREMEKSARDEVDKAIRLTANGFECVVHVSVDLPSDQRIIMVHFALAGNRLKVEYRVNRDTPRADIGPGLVRAISDKIAEQVLAPLAQQMRPRGGTP